jgi:hypothetical protein
MAVQIPLRRAETRRLQTVQIAAGVGAVLACFELYLLIAWIAGPNFARVTPGPSVPPSWMRIAIDLGEVFSMVLLIGLVYRFVVRPWRSERQLPFDGLLFLSAVATSLYDPLNSYFHPWFAYNSYFFNRGNPLLAFPGWQAGHAPGAQTAWPILFIPPLYAGMFVGLGALGCMIIRRTSARWPSLPVWLHVGICFLAMCLIDAATEGPLVMRLGFYDHTGQSIGPLDSTYGHNAIRNIVFVGATVTLAVCLRYFRNDVGETLVERGINRIGANGRTGILLRGLAIYAAFQAILLFGYHIPVAISTLITHPQWHADMIHHSYLNDHLCGVGTLHHCPPS